jgi:hypothetical protein
MHKLALSIVLSSVVMMPAAAQQSDTGRLAPDAVYDVAPGTLQAYRLRKCSETVAVGVRAVLQKSRGNEAIEARQGKDCSSVPPLPSPELERVSTNGERSLANLGMSQSTGPGPDRRSS